MGNQKIGILGLTADPITNAHLALARAAVEWGLDKVIVIVCNVPSTKQGRSQLAPADFRNKITHLAVDSMNEPRVEVWDVEIERGGVSFMADTLEQLNHDYGIVDPWLIVGSDNDPKTWKDPDRIAHFAPRLLVAPRPHAVIVDQLPYWSAAAIDILPDQGLSISSTNVREELRAGRPVAHLVPPAIHASVVESGYYAGAGTEIG